MSADCFHLRRVSASRTRDLTLVANLAIPALGSVSAVALARSLGPGDRGDLAAVQAVPIIFAAMASLGMSEAVAYHVARSSDPLRRVIILRSALLLWIVGSTACLLISLLLVRVVLETRGGTVVVSGYIAAVYVPSLAFVLVAQGWSRGHDRLMAWNFLRLFPTAAWVACAVVLSFVAPSTRSMSIAFAASGLLSAVVAAAQLRGGVIPNSHLSGPVLRDLLKYGMSVAASTLPRALNIRLDQVILVGFVSSSDLGLYVTAVAWVSLISAFGSVRAIRSFATIAPLHGAARVRVIRQTYGRCLVTSLSAGAIVGLITPVVFPILFGPEFDEGTRLALMLLPAGVALSMMTVSTTLLWASGRLGALLIADLSAFAVTALLLVLLAPRFGVTGAIVATTLAYLVAVSIATVVLWGGDTARTESYRRTPPGGE